MKDKRPHREMFLGSFNFHFFKKKEPRPKWIIYKYVSDYSKKCLSVDNSGIQSVVV